MISNPPTVEPLSSITSDSGTPVVRILIADDHQFVLKRAVSALQQHFQVVGTANNGKMLVEEALRLQPEIIVSDVLMPGLNGLGAARELRERGCTAKLIFLSVYDRYEFVKACFEEGGQAYVTKARMGTDLVLAINEVLAGRQFISPSIQGL